MRLSKCVVTHISSGSMLISEIKSKDPNSWTRLCSWPYLPPRLLEYAPRIGNEVYILGYMHSKPHKSLYSKTNMELRCHRSSQSGQYIFKLHLFGALWNMYSYPGATESILVCDGKNPDFTDGCGLVMTSIRKLTWTGRRYICRDALACHPN